MTNTKIILASASPRRHELLLSVGLPHEILVTDADETPRGKRDASQTAAEYFATEASKTKAEAALSALQSRLDGGERLIVVASDTVVSPDGEKIFGKPASDENACSMLRTLSGGAHYVVGGITVTDGKKTVTRRVTTEVHFKSLTDEEISAYVATGECRDKAGAYGIQALDGRFVTHIVGDYPNVVGISVFALWDILSGEFGFNQ